MGKSYLFFKITTNFFFDLHVALPSSKEKPPTLHRGHPKPLYSRLINLELFLRILIRILLKFTDPTGSGSTTLLLSGVSIFNQE